MTWGKSLLLAIPLILSGILAVASPAAASTWTDSRTGWTSVSAGGAHTCGIRAGKLYCWGDNTYGQVGNGGDGHQDVPDDIGSGTDWTSVSTGTAHTCAIRARSLYCWGRNATGQIGDGTTTQRPSPKRIGTSGVWALAAAGSSHSCAITTSRSLYCWGNNTTGQIGDGTTTQRPTPRRIGTAGAWTTAATGGTHTCAITTGKSLYCWGNNSTGQIGDGTTTRRLTPRRIGTAGAWTTAATGGMHTCAITTGKSLYCWGNNTTGQIGDGTTTQRPTPRRIGTAGAWALTTTGNSHTCAITTGKSLYCWGDNANGQVYEPSATPRFLTPVRLYRDKTDYRQTDVGDRTSCAIRGAGILSCWGDETPAANCPTMTYVRPTSIDLRHWKLTTPVDGSDDGTAADEVKYGGSPLNLATLDGTDYFDRLAGGGIRFRARAGGATTSSSDFPRSELREMTQDGEYDEAAWDRRSGIHVMRIHQSINHTLVAKKHVVAGQIHDGSDDMLQIRLEGSTLRLTAKDGESSGVLDDSYALGTPFDLLIQADPCGIRVKYNNNTPVTVPFTDAESNDSWYFKAGVYTQSNPDQGDLATAYGEVTIFGLDVDHSS